MTVRVMMVGQFPRSLSQIDGGVEAATTYLSQALVRLPGVEVIGIRMAGKRLMGPSEDLGWPVRTIELGRFGVSTLFHQQKRRLASLVQEVKPDIIHAQGADVSGYLVVQSGAPAIVTIHGILSECAKLRSNLVRKVREYAQAIVTESFVVERAQHLVAISPYVTRYYQQRLRGRIFEIPNAVAPAFFDVQRKPEVGRLLFAGRISYGKGLIDLVKAVSARRMSVRKLVLAGAVPDRNFETRLRAEIRANDLESHIEFPGLLDERSLLDEFARATALVLPSFQETAPMVIQQAMAAGLPVVATRVGGIPEMIKHDHSGLLFEPGDIDSLGRLLQSLIVNPELGHRLSLVAQAKARDQFTAEKVALATLSSYKAVLGVS